MKKLLNISSVSALCMTLSLSVNLMGLHAKEVTALSHPVVSKKISVTKKIVDSDTGMVKLSHDPHNHVDHQTSKSIVKASAEQTMQADARNLRKVRQRRDRKPIRLLRFSLRLLPVGV